MVVGTCTFTGGKLIFLFIRGSALCKRIFPRAFSEEGEALVTSIHEGNKGYNN